MTRSTCGCLEARAARDCQGAKLVLGVPVCASGGSRMPGMRDTPDAPLTAPRSRWQQQTRTIEIRRLDILALALAALTERLTQ